MARVAWPQPLTLVTLCARRNRFAVEAVDGGGRRLYLHLPNSGRMTELLLPGTPGLAHLPARPRGRTAGTLLAVRHRDRWVGVDAGVPNRLFVAALKDGALEPFRGYRIRRREQPWDGGRVDFALEGPVGPCLVETKSCNRVDGGVALFPDAPTARGARHLRGLAAAAARGLRCAVVWFVQRDDAGALRPFEEADPGFAAAVAEAARAGVELYAYRCRVTPAAIELGAPIPVLVPEPPAARPR